MTVVTPGGPCLTQTQIFRDEQLARFKEKSDAKAAQAPNPYQAAAAKNGVIAANAVTGLENSGAANSATKSYGAPEPHMVDISV